ncbi:MAG: hypothetical protein Kow0068_10090 [Marinilabiliales bacterium]
MKKILCIGDSLSLPGHGNKYEDTWIYKLRQKFESQGYHFITFFQRALTSDVLIKQGGDGSDCLEIYEPDIVILQIGIVDCAPRLISPGSFNYYFIKVIPSKLKPIYLNFLKKIKKRNAKRVYVKPDKFKSNIHAYLQRCSDINIEQILIIGICTPDERMIKKNPEIIKNVKLYNKILQNEAANFSFANIIFPLDPQRSSEMIYEDGYHPNPVGNNLVYNELIAYLKRE